MLHPTVRPQRRTSMPPAADKQCERLISARPMLAKASSLSGSLLHSGGTSCHIRSTPRERARRIAFPRPASSISNVAGA